MAGSLVTFLGGKFSQIARQVEMISFDFPQKASMITP